MTQLNWHRLILNYYEIFGRENVLVLPQEMLKAEPEKFYGKLYAFTGLPRAVAKTGAKGFDNRGYSYLSAKIALVLNRFLVRDFNSCGFIKEKPFNEYFKSIMDRGPFWRAMEFLTRGMQLRALLQQGLDRIYYWDRPLINKEITRDILDIHKESNASLESLCSLGLEEWGYF